MKKILSLLYISGLLLPGRSLAQEGTHPGDTKTSVHVASNTGFNKAGRFKRIMLGEHYRKDWATAVDIEILDMNQEAGGLTPVKLGGGMQTRSLRLKGANGKEYVLRSINKDPSKAIAVEFRGTFAEDFIQDQISSANPYAPLVVAALAEAAGVPHTQPKIVYVPETNKLGTYANLFQGTVCLLEERAPVDDQSETAAAHAKKVVNSEKLFEKYFSNSNHRVDESAYLKARLLDILIGDWDRHEDQWQWAVYEESGKTIYRPIPRDRDQAFSRMDGVIPQMATQKWALRKIQGFDYRIKDLVGLTTSGVHLDRNFTTTLSKQDWINITTAFQQAVTDQVIDEACKLLPKEIYYLSGNDIAAKLKQRRNDLQTYAAKYYRFLSNEVNITGTNDAEIFEVTRISDDSTLVSVFSTDKAGKKYKLVYQRCFLRSETNEIRLYGLEGKDQFIIDGSASDGITVRAIGGKGKDIYLDRSLVKGPGKKTKIYDNADNTITGGRETSTYISSDTLANNYNRRSYRYDWMAPMLHPGYNPDDGFYFGSSVVFKKQQFGKSPYGFMQAVGANYAFKTGAYTFWYKGIFTEVIGKWDLVLDANINAPNYSRNYFGLGNETERKETGRNYYRARFDQYTTSASIRRKYAGKHFLEAGVGFESVKVEERDGRFVSSSSSKLDSSDFEKKYYVHIKTSYQFNTLNNALYPTKGIRVNSGVSFTQNLQEEDLHYVQLFAEMASYYTRGRFTLASRSGFSTILNDRYEFFQANTLGSLSNLRGYRRDRFAGKTSLYSNTELRYSAGYINSYLLNGRWGLLAFLDNGRVWIPGEDSNTWHRGYGGGIWVMPFNKMAFTATYGASKEDQVVTVKAGFLF